jgi:glycosyltransferase involved in cell wall biosynthesis
MVRHLENDPSNGSMRVLHVIESMDQGGAAAMVVEHVRHAGPRVESVVVALRRGGPALDAAIEAGATGVVLGRPPGPAGRLTAANALVRLVRQHNISILNGHNPTGALSATYAAFRTGVPVIRTEHGAHFVGRHSHAYPVLEALTTLATSRVVCVCEAVRASHAPRFGWATRRFVTILNGTSNAHAARPRAATRNQLGLLETDRLILAIGTLTRPKAHSVLVEAFQRVARRMSAATLLIVGEGPLHRTLEHQIADAGLADRVRLLGGRNDIPDLVAAADAFVTTSVRDGLSVALLEAMRGGCPVVASNAGGNAEAIVDGTSGWLVEPRNPGKTAEALLELLEDRVRAASFAREARRRWSELFTSERMVAETETLYRAVLRRQGARMSASPAGAQARERAS